MKTKIKLDVMDSFVFLLAVSLFYYSYRYIFKWANEGTSGTYSSTPVAIQVAKYLICGITIIFAIIVSLICRNNFNMKNKMMFIVLFFALVNSAYAFLLVRDQNTLMLFVGMSVIFSMMFTIGGSIDFESIDKLFIFFINVNIIYETVQIALYVTTGRLPAIAWADAGIMQVRFGGVFDEPFALSLFMAFLIPYLYHRFSGIKRVIYVGISIIMLILTWTLTSTFAIVGIFVIDRLYAYAKGKGMKAHNLFVFILACMGIIVFSLTYGEEFMAELIKVKSGSVQAHIATRSLDGLSFFTLIGLKPEAHYAESTLSRMFFTNGIFFTACFYIIGIVSGMRLTHFLKKIPENEIIKRSIISGMLYYQLSFLLGSLNLPFPYMFFNMMIFSIFAGISFVYKNEVYD